MNVINIRAKPPRLRAAQIEQRTADFLQSRDRAGRPPGLSEAAYSELLQTGVLALKAGLCARAKTCFELLIDAAPQVYLGHHYLAMAQSRTGHFEDALDHFQDALECLRQQAGFRRSKTPVWADIHLQVTATLVQLGRPQEALETLQSLRQKAPITARIRAQDIDSMMTWVKEQTA